jgi:hypothetical protein
MVTLVEVLRTLVQLTRLGRVRWIQEEPQLWNMLDGPVQARIEYLRPLLPDGTTPGNDIARITIAGYVDEVCAGTEGMFLIRDLLDAAIPSQAAWSAECNAKLEYAQKLLLKHLEG